jgi:hypothetical protein
MTKGQTTRAGFGSNGEISSVSEYHYWSIGVNVEKGELRFVTKFGINESSTLRFSVLINDTAAAIASSQLTRALSIKTVFGF